MLIYNMFFNKSLTTFFAIGILGSVIFGCQNSASESGLETPSESPENTVIAILEGSQPNIEYDSVFNRMTIYGNESFTLHQVDRIAEHHLNERDHQGVYSFLGENQIGLYSLDGYLMLRFELEGSKWFPTDLNEGSRIPEGMPWRVIEGTFPPSEE